MTEEQSKCPNCGSTDITKACTYAGVREEGQPASKGEDIPNYCHDCGHKWDEETE